jgi:hypothetical protein
MEACTEELGNQVDLAPSDIKMTNNFFANSAGLN